MKTKLFVKFIVNEKSTAFEMWTTNGKERGRLDGTPEIAIPTFADRLPEDETLTIKVNGIDNIKPDRDTLIALSNACRAKGHSIAF